MDTSSAYGRFFFTLMAAVAELESDANSEHMREMVAHIRSKGWAWGRTPFGWRKEGKVLVPDDLERALWRKGKLMQQRGASGNEVAAHWEEMGVLNREGRPYNRTYVYRILSLDFSHNPKHYTPDPNYTRSGRKAASRPDEFAQAEQPAAHRRGAAPTAHHAVAQGVVDQAEQGRGQEADGLGS